MSSKNNYKKDYSSNDDTPLNFEFYTLPFEEWARQRPPGLPPKPTPPPPYITNPKSPTIPGSGAGQPPMDGMPSPPPNYVPSKTEKGVQSLNASSQSPQTKSVSQNSISFCLYQFTYIWETNGKSYWTFIMNIDKVSISGFRWYGWSWVYFGLDLKKIDSFICYRSILDENCSYCEDLRSNAKELDISNNIEYSSFGTREIISIPLISLDIPETKDDFIIENIGIVEDNIIKSKIPCVKSRNTSYRITLEVSFPEESNEEIKTNILEAAKLSAESTGNIFNKPRSKHELSSELDTYTYALKLIPEALITFTKSFNAKMSESSSNSRSNVNNISFAIRKEKLHSNWTPYF